MSKKLDKAKAGFESDISLNEERISAINKELATADAARKKSLEELLDKERQHLEYRKQNLETTDKLLERERKRKELATDSAASVRAFTEQTSLASSLGGKTAEAYEKMAYYADVLADRAGTDSKNKKLVAQWNTKLVESESIREKLVAAIGMKDAEGAQIQQDKLVASQTELFNLAQSKKVSDELKSAMAAQLEGVKQINAETLKGTTLTKEEVDQLSELTAEADRMQGRLAGISNMMTGLLKSPHLWIVAAAMGAEKLGSAMADVNKATGVFNVSTGLLTFVFDDAIESYKQMAKLSGDFNDATLGAQINVGIMSLSMGIGGAEVATLVNAFGNLSGQSREFGEEMARTVENTSRLNGVLPAQVMSDIAASTEDMALYSRGSVENFANAAIQAAKLGVSVSTTSKMADKLLDFESSIESELTTSALLGRDINLQKARELAYLGKTEEMTSEVLRQVGGINEFNKMDVYSKRALADTLGVSVGELQQMVANQNKLNEMSGLEKGWGAVNDWLRAIGAKLGGPIASGITFFAGELLRAKMTAAAIHGGGFMNVMSGGLLGKSGAGAAAGATKSIAASAASNMTPPAASVGDPVKNANKIGGINGMMLIQAAAALLIVAAALWVFAKAAQEFSVKIDWGNVFIGIGAMALLGVVAAGFSSIAPAMIVGAIAFIAVSAALFTFGVASQEVAKGIGMLGPAISASAAGISELSSINFLPILGLAASLATLAAALYMVAVAGVLALPALAGLGIAAAGVSMLFGGSEGGKGSNMSELLAEIKGLRSDFSSGKIAVYMDGRLVSNQLSKARNADAVTTKFTTA